VSSIVALPAHAGAAAAVAARLDRIDATAQSLTLEVRATHSRHERLARQVERLEKRA
jgi:citrate synthase